MSGGHKSAEHRAKIAAALSGKTLPPSTRAKIGDALRGRERPQEVKDKISAAKRMRPMSDSPWPAKDDDLRDLWASGQPAAEIAANLGLTKNAVIGRAHRLCLPSRRSPIIRDGRPRRASRAPRCGKATLAIVPRVTSEALVSTLDLSIARPTISTVFQPRAPQTCCWPMWSGPVPRPAPFCDAATTEGRPYCDRHTARAYLRRSMSDAA